MKNLFTLTLTILLFAARAQIYTVETVPNQKLITGSYVSNPDHLLSAAAVSRIDNILSALEQSSTAQVAVVIVNSIGDQDHVEFAQALFEHWGIGHADNDNGLLILVVRDQHKVRLHTGFGVEGILTDAACKRIEMEDMVPSFKNSDYDGGVIAGVERVATLLNNPELVSDSDNRDLHPTAVFYVVIPFIWSGIMMVPFLFLQFSSGFRGQGYKREDVDVRMTRKRWAMIHIVLPLAVLLATVAVFGVGNGLLYLGLLIGYILFLLFNRYERLSKAVKVLYQEQEYTRIYNLYHEYRWPFLVFAFLLPVPMAFFYMYYVSRRKFYRNHPRPCPTCRTMMVKMGEQADDQYLDDSEIFEEKIGSVDYDIWFCPTCNATSKITFLSSSTKYSECPACSTRAQYSKSRKTIVSATTSSSGRGEETRECKYCHHQEVKPYTIPKVSRSSSSSGGSSSGGGSWGGGSSGGGGASSSW